MLRVAKWVAAAAVVITFIASCGGSKDRVVISNNVPESTRTMRLEFLTRDGCKNTPLMMSNLESAIERAGLLVNVEVVHQAKLAEDDARVGYPTPTILIDVKDLFGSPIPVPPFPSPS
jgi:hypothetical protein